MAFNSSNFKIYFIFVTTWCCVLHECGINGYILKDRLDRSTKMVPLNKSDVNNSIPPPSNLTLLITAPIAAGIFLLVVLFFCLIFFEKPPVNSTDHYERLTHSGVVDDDDERLHIPQHSPPTSSNAANKTEPETNSSYNIATTSATIEVNPND